MRANELKSVDAFFDGLILQLKVQRSKVKKDYSEAWQHESERLYSEQEEFQKHLSLINFTKDTVQKTVQEIENITGMKVKGNEIATKLENFRK